MATRDVLTILVILSQANECDSDPCQNDGTCRDHVNGFTCECHPDYNGTLCEHAIPTPQLSTSVPGTAEPDTWTKEKDTSATTGRDVTATTKAPTGHHNTRNTTRRGAETNEKQGDRTDTLLWWLIGVTATLVVIVILVVVLLLGCVSCHRKRNQQSDEQDLGSRTTSIDDLSFVNGSVGFNQNGYDMPDIISNGSRRMSATMENIPMSGRPGFAIGGHNHNSAHSWNGPISSA